MMEIDQPVVSQVDKDVDPSSPGAEELKRVNKSPILIVQENDELPALVISDSEGDDTIDSATDSVEIKLVKDRDVDKDISATSPLKVTDVDVVDQSVVAVKGEQNEAHMAVAKETENSAAVDQQETLKVYENIDLTGLSSADESGISDQGCETGGSIIIESGAKVVKDCTKLTAQELLQSLMGTQEDETLSTEAVNAVQPAECSDLIKLNDESSKQLCNKTTENAASFDEEQDVPVVPTCDSAGSQQEEKTAKVEQLLAEKRKNGERTERRATTLSTVEQSDKITASEQDSGKNSSSDEDVGGRKDVDDPQNTNKAGPCDTQDADYTVASNGLDDSDLVLLEEPEHTLGPEQTCTGDNSESSSPAIVKAASSTAEGSERKIKKHDTERRKTPSPSEDNVDDLMHCIEEPPRKRARSSLCADTSGNIVALETQHKESSSCAMVPLVEPNEMHEEVDRADSGKSDIVNDSVKSDNGADELGPNQSVIEEHQNQMELGDESADLNKSFTEERQSQTIDSSMAPSNTGDLEQTMDLMVTSTTLENVGAKNQNVTKIINTDATADATTTPPSPHRAVLIIVDDDDVETSVNEGEHHDDVEVEASVNASENRTEKDSELVLRDIADISGKHARDVQTSHDKKILELNTLLEDSSHLPEKKTADDVPSTSSQPVRTQGNPLKMDFMKHFAKPLMKMTRNDLEELTLQKVGEALLCKSELAETRKQFEKLKSTMQDLRKRLADLGKQHSDLKTIHDRLMVDLRTKTDQYTAPVKITRAVGLQVNMTPQLISQAIRASELHNNAGDPTRHLVGELSPMPVANTGLQADGGGSEANTNAKKRRNSATSSQYGSTVQGRNIINQTPSTFATEKQPNKHPPLNVIRTTAAMNITFVHNSTPSAVTIRPTGVSRVQNGVNVQALPAHRRPSATSTIMTTSSRCNSIRNISTVSTATSSNQGTPSGEGKSSAPGTARKKTSHKITPMRPPLSAYQQEQQDKQARQQQAQLLRDIQSHQARIANIASSRKDHLPTGGESSIPESYGGIRQTVPPRIASTQNRSKTTSAPVSATHRASVGTSRSHSTVTSTTSNFGEQPAQTVTPATQRLSMATDNSLIDLTDEDESPRIATVAGGAVMPGQNHLTQNGTQHQQLPLFISSVPSEEVGGNQMVRVNQMARTSYKKGLPNANGSGISAGNHTATNASGTEISLNKFTGRRPLITKRLLTATEQAGRTSSPSLKRLARHSTTHVDHAVAVSKQSSSKQGIFSVSLPAPPPPPEPQLSNPEWKQPPQQPTICINNVPNGIVISWSMPQFDNTYAEIQNYQIYAYQETSPKSTSDAWRHVGDVEALPLPMAVTLTHFYEGLRYHFVVRAIDVHKRVGSFSDPRTWNDNLE